MELLKKADDIAGDNRVLIMGDFNVPNIVWEDKNLKLELKLLNH